MDTAIRDFEASRPQATAPSLDGTADSAEPIEQRLRSAQAAFDRTHQRHTGLDSASQRASLEHTTKLRELGELVRANKIDERLAALKAERV
jgi:phage shock protein A